ncbi:hypothetical protein [Lewinella sp. W8]|uniref:hypothetical protein n=1 Tax=Lewinella sp. W8 TaxID=2528208 RepID=UPI001067CFC3|nr:hypothetical protein [Lewinella sp. W8]MTB53007.1 hypothetical protein [Lewinella sp. W8]
MTVIRNEVEVQLKPVFYVDRKDLKINKYQVYDFNIAESWVIGRRGRQRTYLPENISIRATREDAEKAIAAAMEIEVEKMERRLQEMQDWLQANDWPLDVLKINLKDKRATQEI